MLAGGIFPFAGIILGRQVELSQHLVADAADNLGSLGIIVGDDREAERPQVFQQDILRGDRAEELVLVSRVHSGSSDGVSNKSIRPTEASRAAAA